MKTNIVIDELLNSTRTRVSEMQDGIPTYYDRRVLRQAQEPDPEWLGRLQRHAAAREEGRFVARSVRSSVQTTGLDRQRRSEIPDDVLIMSQGTFSPLRWRGRDLFKNVFDFSLMSMLLPELRPATVLEIGSGTGTSALWLSDLATLYGFPCRIISVDINPVRESHPNVEFHTGDARELRTLLPGDALAVRPRLIVEDAHVGVREVLEYAHGMMEEGDYIVVEDSVGKSAQLDDFTATHKHAYAVDTYYTDFFGRNATSCVDSILRRMR